MSSNINPALAYLFERVFHAFLKVLVYYCTLIYYPIVVGIHSSVADAHLQVQMPRILLVSAYNKVHLEQPLIFGKRITKGKEEELKIEIYTWIYKMNSVWDKSDMAVL